MLVASQPWSRHADTPVIVAGQDEIEDVHYAVAIGISGTPRFNNLAVMTRDSGHVEDVDDMVPVCVTGADERQQGKKKTEHGCHLLGAPAGLAPSGAGTERVARNRSAVCALHTLAPFRGKRHE